MKDKLSKLEAQIGVKSKANPFQNHKTLPYMHLDWTTEELFRKFMGDESVAEKDALTDWSEWNSKHEEYNSPVRQFMEQLTNDQLETLENKWRSELSERNVIFEYGIL